MFRDLVIRFVCDEKAAEVTELALVFALIVAGAILVISSLGQKVQSMYETTDSGLP